MQILKIAAGAVLCGATCLISAAPPTSYMPVVAKEDFQTTFERMKAARAGLMREQAAFLESRYDLSNRPAAGVTMFRGKPVQEGIRVKLPRGTT